MLQILAISFPLLYIRCHLELHRFACGLYPVARDHLACLVSHSLDITRFEMDAVPFDLVTRFRVGGILLHS